MESKAGLCKLFRARSLNKIVEHFSAAAGRSPPVFNSSVQYAMEGTKHIATGLGITGQLARNIYREYQFKKEHGVDPEDWSKNPNADWKEDKTWGAGLGIDWGADLGAKPEAS